MTHENYMKFKFHCPCIKFYRNTAMLICWDVVCGCFPCYRSRAESLQQTVWLTKLKIFIIWPFAVKVYQPLV